MESKSIRFKDYLIDYLEFNNLLIKILLTELMLLKNT